MGSFEQCILCIGQCPHHGTSLEVSLPPYLPSSHAPPCTSPSLRCILPPPLASSLPSFPRSVNVCSYVPSSLVPFLNPPSLPPLPLPPSLTSSIPHSLPLLNSLLHPPLVPSLPSFLALSPPPSLPACRPPCNAMYTMCVLIGKLL